MEDVKIVELEKEIAAIVKDYLYKISSGKKHDYFGNRENANYRRKYYEDTSFSLLAGESENTYVVKEEMFLEGCTRAFLINPIMEKLMNCYGIEHVWKNGTTYSDFTISNREYELDAYLEFIAILDLKKKVGIRYTPLSYSANEAWALDKDFEYLYAKEKKEVPGFDEIRTIDEIYILNWSNILEDDLKKIQTSIPGVKILKKDITARDFFIKYFSEKAYKIVIAAAKAAVIEAKKIIALQAVPQLLSNNMLIFKNTVLDNFTEEKMDSISYKFRESNNAIILDDTDVQVIKEAFFDKGYYKALIGNHDFAKSFITSEYLFRTIKDGLSIDYTSVVIGYLKSVEQLLYLLYESAFEGKKKIAYWDRCKKASAVDVVSKPEEYRYDPYDSEQERIQKKWFHKKCSKRSIELGKLNEFLRYYEKMWFISEKGKEYVYKCLDDFRVYCRNAHCHKDNINHLEYDKVERIRNNTYVCLYYLLGGFKLLDLSKTAEEQLEIVDYSFELLYQEIWQKRRKHYEARFSDGSEFILYYLNDDVNVKFNESGMMPNAELRFLKIGTSKNLIFSDDGLRLSADADYVKNNTITITRNCMPEYIKAIMPQKRTKNEL